MSRVVDTAVAPGGDPRMPRAKHALAAAALAAASFAAAAAQAQRAASMVDLYGYTAGDGATCAAAFTDIAATGSALVPTGVGATPAGDDGGAVLALAQPFEHYGVAHGAIVVSTDGYLAFADALARDSGTDFSADCTLPAVPDAGAFGDGETRAATPARAYVHHGDLKAGATGTLHAQFFAACPRPASAGAEEPCTIVQWSQFRDADDATVTAQAVLYHVSHELALVRRESGSAAATIGIQNADATTALVAQCGVPVAANGAVCYSDPRFPPGSRAPASPDALFGNSFE